MHDVCRKAVFAHMNPMTYAKESILPTPLRKQIRGRRKCLAHRQGLEQLHNKEKKSDRRATRASSDVGPELAGREGHAAMESQQALIAPLERGSGGGLKRNARSVRGWDRVPMKKQDQGGKSSLG